MRRVSRFSRNFSLLTAGQDFQIDPTETETKTKTKTKTVTEKKGPVFSYADEHQEERGPRANTGAAHVSAYSAKTKRHRNDRKDTHAQCLGQQQLCDRHRKLPRYIHQATALSLKRPNFPLNEALVGLVNADHRR